MERAKFVKDAADRLAAEQAAFLVKHRLDWFEIGHIDYSDGGQTLYIDHVNASPLESLGGGSIPITLANMDAIYSKFREAARQGIDAEVNQRVSEMNSFRNDEGSYYHVTQEDIDRYRRDAEIKARKQRLVMAAQGDLVNHKIDRLMLVDYDTESVIAEFSPKTIEPAESKWKF